MTRGTAICLGHSRVMTFGGIDSDRPANPLRMYRFPGVGRETAASRGLGRSRPRGVGCADAEAGVETTAGGFMPLLGRVSCRQRHGGGFLHRPRAGSPPTSPSRCAGPSPSPLLLNRGTPPCPRGGGEGFRYRLWERSPGPEFNCRVGSRPRNGHVPQCGKSSEIPRLGCLTSKNPKFN